MNSFDNTNKILSVDSDGNINSKMDSKVLFDSYSSLETKIKSYTDKLQTTVNETKVQIDADRQTLIKFRHVQQNPDCYSTGWHNPPVKCKEGEYARHAHGQYAFGKWKWGQANLQCCKLPLTKEQTSKTILPPTIPGEKNHYICDTQCKTKSICVVDNSTNTTAKSSSTTAANASGNNKIYYECPL